MRGGAGSDSGSSASPVRTRGRGRPRRADPTCQRERGENGSWAGARELGRERGFGPWEKEEKERKIGPVWAAGKRRKRKREIGLSWKERGEETFSIFL